MPLLKIVTFYNNWYSDSEIISQQSSLLYGQQSLADSRECIFAMSHIRTGMCIVYAIPNLTYARYGMDINLSMNEHPLNNASTRKKLQ